MDAAYTPEIFHLPFPSSFSDEECRDMLARADQLCATATAIWDAATSSGQTLHVDQDNQLEARLAFDDKSMVPHITQTATALHLTALLTEYDHHVVQSAQQLRNLCTNLLIEKAVKGKTETVQLRAVEMLGKIADVALFEDRSVILVGDMTTDEIKNGLRQTINALRAKAGGAVDVTPRVPHEPQLDPPQPAL